MKEASGSVSEDTDVNNGLLRGEDSGEPVGVESGHNESEERGETGGEGTRTDIREVEGGASDLR